MSFTRIPNAIIDESKLNPYQFQLFSIIVRKTDGWCKVEDGISLSQFQKMVTFSKNTIIKTLRQLEELGYIEIIAHFDSEKKIHSYNTYKVSQGVVHEVNKGSSRGEQGVVHEVNKQKKAITKETNTINKKNTKKENLVQVLKTKELGAVNKKSLYEWLEFKNWNYKKAGITKLVNMLSKYSFETQQEMIDNSIMNNYQGLFAPKNQNKPQYKQNRGTSRDLIENALKVPSSQNIEDCEIIDE